MDGTIGTVGAAVGMFAGTNVDDLVILTVLFLASRTGGRPRNWQIWAGQYAGTTALVAASAVGAVGLTVVPDDWVGLLGLIPFALGVRGLVGALRGQGDDDDAPNVAGGVFSVAGITIANGADNVSVYTPVFRTIGPGAAGVTIVVFAVGVAVWCLTASWLGSHKGVIHVIERYGKWLVPVVFMAIGTSVVLESVR
ncbi:MAG TPA: cadmium resistance transporter [Thermomonospora sp.]|nr:cadmium resistance transporter [Thermomonospora sp.]